ncbi:MAG: hypothetical protein KAH68_05815, partial [Draconibacterium sp.]|nr:hypothetical protein [Draconibacterium sp.]
LEAEENLMQIKQLLESIKTENYRQQIDTLSNSTIGQHIRHILEFYRLLVTDTFTETISFY